MALLAFILLLFQVDTIPMPTLIVESSHTLFTKAVSITAAADGRLYCADQSDHSVSMIKSDNSVSKKIGGQGWGTDAFDMPTDVSTSFLLDLFVADHNNRRVQRFDKQLQFIQTYDEETIRAAGRMLPIATAVSSTGDLFILDADGLRILKINTRSEVVNDIGNFTGSANSIRDPKDLAVSHNDEVIVLDGSRIIFFDIFGNYQRTIPLDRNHEWKSISVSDRQLLVISTNLIALIDLDTSEQLLITPESIVGDHINPPFSDALVLNDRLIILSHTTLYRCLVQKP